MPVRIFNAADRPPTGMTTVPDTAATLTSLLVTLTTVSAVAGVPRSGTSRLGWPPSALYTRPTWGTGRSSTPTGVETTSGTEPGGGVPTTIVNCRVSAPAWNVSVATPWLPIWMMTSAVCAPAATVTFARTVTIEGLLVATLTGVGAGAGFDRSRTPSVCCPPIAVNT